VLDPSANWWVVPIKSFDSAKQRLRGRLAADERRSLAIRLADGVLSAIQRWPIVVVCSDDEVTQFATQRGAAVAHDPGEGLNSAAHAGAMHALEHGALRVSVIHADLPLSHDLPTLLSMDALRDTEALLVPDRNADGSNVLSIPASAFRSAAVQGFRYQYGPGSAQRHRTEITRMDLWLHERRLPSLALDIDTPEDLDLWDRIRSSGGT
jgi:2-phospho-L-lactate/phosphoenolpyruvate guanylyltransferase